MVPQKLPRSLVLEQDSPSTFRRSYRCIPSREWMYNRLDGKYLSKVFVQKVEEFINFACRQEEFQRCYKLKCPCSKCRNVPYHDVDTIKLHLYRRGFRPNYYRWVHHGEPFPEEEVVAPSSTTLFTAPVTTNVMTQLVMDAYVSTSSSGIQELHHYEEHESIPEAKQLNRRPSAAELFAATHSKVDANGQRIWCNAHAQSVYEKYEQLKLNTDVQVGSQADDHIFFKACEEWSEKGTVYRLGRESPMLYERPARRGGSGTSFAYSPSFIALLQERLSTTENALQSIQERLHSTEEELRSIREELGSTRQELEVMKKILEDQRLAILELNDRFDNFSSLLGHPARADNSQPCS